MKTFRVNPKTTFNPQCSERMCTASALSAHGSSLEPHLRFTWTKIFPRLIRFWIGCLTHQTRDARVKHPHQLQVANGHVRALFQMRLLARSFLWVIRPFWISFSSHCSPLFLNSSTSLYIYIFIHFWKYSFKRQLVCKIDTVEHLF